MTRLERSYVHGAATTPLIGETIALPAALEAAMSRPRTFERIAPRIEALRELL